MKRIGLILIAGLLFSSPGRAADPDELTNRIFALTYNQQYAASAALQDKSRGQIDPLYDAVLEIDRSYWENVTGTDTPDYPEFEKVLRKYNRETADSGEETIRLITLSYQLRYQLKRFKLISALATRKKTIQLFQEVQEATRSLNTEHSELLRLYRALIAYFDNYLKPVFSRSKKERMEQAIAGMEALTTSQQPVVQTLSAYFLGKIYLKYHNLPEEGARHFRALADRYPGNRKFPELLQACEEK